MTAPTSTARGGDERVSAAAGQGFRLLREALASDGPRQEDGISTELMMYTVALEVWTLPHTTSAPLTV